MGKSLSLALSRDLTNLSILSKRMGPSMSSNLSASNQTWMENLMGISSSVFVSKLMMPLAAPNISLSKDLTEYERINVSLSSCQACGSLIGTIQDDCSSNLSACEVPSASSRICLEVLSSKCETSRTKTPASSPLEVSFLE